MESNVKHEGVILVIEDREKGKRVMGKVGDEPKEKGK